MFNKVKYKNAINYQYDFTKSQTPNELNPKITMSVPKKHKTVQLCQKLKSLINLDIINDAITLKPETSDALIKHIQQTMNIRIPISKKQQTHLNNNGRIISYHSYEHYCYMLDVQNHEREYNMVPDDHPDYIKTRLPNGEIGMLKTMKTPILDLRASDINKPILSINQVLMLSLEVLNFNQFMLDSNTFILKSHIEYEVSLSLKTLINTFEQTQRTLIINQFLNLTSQKVDRTSGLNINISKLKENILKKQKEMQLHKLMSIFDTLLSLIIPSIELSFSEHIAKEVTLLEESKYSLDVNEYYQIESEVSNRINNIFNTVVNDSVLIMAKPSIQNTEITSELLKKYQTSIRKSYDQEMNYYKEHSILRKQLKGDSNHEQN